MTILTKHLNILPQFGWKTKTSLASSFPVCRIVVPGLIGNLFIQKQIPLSTQSGQFVNKFSISPLIMRRLSEDQSRKNSLICKEKYLEKRSQADSLQLQAMRCVAWSCPAAAAARTTSGWSGTGWSRSRYMVRLCDGEMT